MAGQEAPAVGAADTATVPEPGVVAASALNTQKSELSPDHIAAANRPRRIAVNYDIWGSCLDAANADARDAGTGEEWILYETVLTEVAPTNQGVNESRSNIR